MSDQQNGSIDPARYELDVKFDDGPMCNFCPKFMNLTVTTATCAIIGILLGYGCNQADDCTNNKDWIAIIKYPGDLWISVLKLLGGPLIITLMILTPNTMKADASALGTRAVVFYIFTSTVAAIQGLIWVNIIKPGDGTHFDASLADDDEEAITSAKTSELDSLLKIGRLAFPKNIVEACAELNILGMIVFFLIGGMYLKEVEESKRRVLLDFTSAVQECIIKAILIVVKFTPIGAMSAVAGAVASSGDINKIFDALGLYLLTAVIGQLVHCLVVYPAIFFFFTRTNPIPFMKKIKQSPFTAFATSSSAATLPVTLRVSKEAGVREHIRQFVLPLGSAINMDGTALGYPIMVMFGAQYLGMDVSAGTQIVVALLGITSSIGTAPIPNAGIIYVSMLLQAAGITDTDSQLTVVGLILVWDWLVDRLETQTNVLSDNICCKILEASEDEVGVFRFFPKFLKGPVISDASGHGDDSASHVQKNPNEV